MTTTREVLAWIATIESGTAVDQSSILSVVLNITGGHRIRVPIAIQMSNVSQDPVIKIYRSADGGNSYDTDDMLSIPIGRISAGQAQKTLELKSGYYILQLLNSGPNTATWFVYTQEYLTAYETN